MTSPTTPNHITNIQDFDIPSHDSKVIDESIPGTVIITYKKGGVTVKTKTIITVGGVTTFTVS